MYTVPDHRQREIGAAIINYLEEHARRHGARRAHGR